MQRICDPHFGVGSDGVLLLSRSDDPELVAELRIFNPDGSEAELSGNGAREAILYLRRHGWTDDDTFSILTAAGPITPTITSERTCSVAMGRAATAVEGLPVGGRPTAAGRSTPAAAPGTSSTSRSATRSARSSSPDGLEELDLAAIGPDIEGDEQFPNRTNVSFLRIDGSRVRARIFERGVGETLSSGTGACGAAVTAFLAAPPARWWSSSTAASSRSRSPTISTCASAAGPSPSAPASSRPSCSRRSPAWTEPTGEYE